MIGTLAVTRFLCKGHHLRFVEFIEKIGEVLDVLKKEGIGVDVDQAVDPRVQVGIVEERRIAQIPGYNKVLP